MIKGEQVFSGLAQRVETYFASDVSPITENDHIIWSEPGFQLHDYRAKRNLDFVRESASCVSILTFGGELVMVLQDEDKVKKRFTKASVVCAGVFARPSSVVERLPDPNGAKLLNGFYQLKNKLTSFYHIILN